MHEYLLLALLFLLCFVAEINSSAQILRRFYKCWDIPFMLRLRVVVEFGKIYSVKLKGCHEANY